MIKVAILGAGNIGHALGALLGSRPELEVVLWARRQRERTMVQLRAFGKEGTFAIGRAALEPSLVRAADRADVVVIATPTDVRRRVLTELAGRLGHCSLLVSWEGMGRFADLLRELAIDRPIAVGLQRSPLLCRTRRRGQLVEILGVRSQVVAATVDPADRAAAASLMERIFPFRFLFAPGYACVSLSPGNPLIHPARLYAYGRRQPRSVRKRARFYADWDDAASETLLALHGEVAALRDALHLPLRFVRTLADDRGPISPETVTDQIRAAHELGEIKVPMRRGPGNTLTMDRSHRFFREDIGEGLAYILAIARKAKVAMPTAQAIYRWYRKGLPDHPT